MPEGIAPATVSDPTTRLAQAESPTRQVRVSNATSILPHLSEGKPAVPSPSQMNEQPAAAGSIRQSTKSDEAPRSNPPQPSPLALEGLVSLPGHYVWSPPPGDPMYHDGQFTHHYVGALGFPVHPTICSLDSRIECVNTSAEILLGMTTPTTALSIGAGQLLMEDLIHLQQSAETQSRTKWRPVDTKYGQGQAREARAQFKEGKANVRMFATVEAYLLAEGPELRRASEKGESVMMLLCDPPTMVPNDGPATLPGGVTLVGQPITEANVKKSNSIVIYFQDKTPEGQANLDRFVSNVASSRVTDTMFVKCWPGEEGKPQYEIGARLKPFEDMIRNFVAAGMQQAHGVTPIEKLYAGVKTFVSGLNGQSQAQSRATCTPFSDFARSVDRIEKYLASLPGPVALVRLENSKVTVTRRNC